MRQAISTLFLLLLPACVAQAKYDQALSDLAGVEDAKTKLEQAKTECDAQLAKLESDLAAKLEATREELEELRRQREAAERRLAAFKDLQDKFKSMIDAGSLEVYMRRGRMVVGLPSKVLFRSGKADLSKRGRRALGRVAKVLGQLGRRIQVAGHTDNMPIGEKLEFEDNWELSTARALTVTRFLVDKKVSPENLAAAGYGEFDPVADNSKRGGRRRNRRIELVLVPDLTELPQMAQP